MVWPLSGLLEHCQACGAASMASGILAGVDLQGARVGGAGSARFAFGGLLREGGRPVGGMDPQKHSVGCLRGASKFGEGNWFPLGFRLGMGKGDGACQLVFPCLAELCLLGLTTSPS